MTLTEHDTLTAELAESRQIEHELRNVLQLASYICSLCEAHGYFAAAVKGFRTAEAKVAQADSYQLKS